MLIGSFPPMGATPSSALAAAVCDTGKPPQATTYVEIDGTCCRK
jgi:hypothetical protein